MPPCLSRQYPTCRACCLSRTSTAAVLLHFTTSSSIHSTQRSCVFRINFDMDRDIELLWNNQPDINADLSTPTTLPPRMEDDPALDLPEPARPSKHRTRTYKPPVPLDSGFMAPSIGGEVTLKQLLNIISSKDAENRDLTILSYWARGSASGGDEAKMNALNIDS